MSMQIRRDQLMVSVLLFCILVGRSAVAATEESTLGFLAEAEQALHQGEEAERGQHLGEAAQAYLRGLAILDKAGIRDNFVPTNRSAEL